ncbi:N-acetyltransferase 9-like protein [Symsagittifera roscoffensis]|uniref:N-acetyltransferase 9-like protein n=1 Tax=Symsagittifera roscoffensis TaxID=84072 RepID=UPI00307BED45
MRLNQNVIVMGKVCWLVPYGKNYVEKYHSWMLDENLRCLTASELLTSREEYEMQKSWLDDKDKLTFLILNPVSVKKLSDSGAVCACSSVSIVFSLCRSEFGSQCESNPNSKVSDRPICEWCKLETGCLIGDINLFIDTENSRGEINMMVASEEQRGKGFGKAAYNAFIFYVVKSLKLKEIIAKISESNLASMAFFTKLGFKEISRAPVFSEITLSKQLDSLNLEDSNFEIKYMN